MSPLLDEAAPLLRRQHALVTSRQLRLLGAHPQQISRLVERRVWEPLDHGVYGPTGVPHTWRRRLMTAILAGPPGTVASHRAAAHLLGVGGLDDPAPELSIPRGTTFRRDGVITHESTDLDLAETLLVDHIPTTGPRRLAMDLGAVVSPARFTHTVRELRHGHGVSSDGLLRTYLRHKRQGRNGGAALRDWLDRYFEVSGVSESGPELIVLDALLDAGLPTPDRQHWVVTDIGRFRLDLAWPELLIAVEVDGTQHEDLDIRGRDARRTEALELLGWTILRVRTQHLATDLARVLTQLRNLVSASQSL